MSDQFVGEIRSFGFNFAPKGWALCAGQLLPISQNTALFSLLGTYYGGDGRSTFALPNLQGAVAIGQGQRPGGSSFSMGEIGGEVSVVLISSQMPPHTHTLPASGTTAAKQAAPGPSTFLGATGGGRTGGINTYATPIDQSQHPTTMLTTAVGSAGQNLPHNNMAPYLTVFYCISLVGVYPPRQ